MSKVKKIATLLTVFAVVAVLSVLLALPVQAEEPTTEPPVDADGFLETPEGFVPPPLPPIPTRAEYEAGWKTPQHVPEQTEGADGDEAADHPDPCAAFQELKLDYWTYTIPAEQGGGTAEGYAGLYWGKTSGCDRWIRPVAGSRVTYGGQVDMCDVTGRAKRSWPSSDDFFWNRRDEIEPCGLTPARVIERTRFVIPGHKYTVWGNHHFENGDGADFWQANGDTYLNHWVPL